MKSIFNLFAAILYFTKIKTSVVIPPTQAWNLHNSQTERHWFKKIHRRATQICGHHLVIPPQSELPALQASESYSVTTKITWHRSFSSSHHSSLHITLWLKGGNSPSKQNHTTISQLVKKTKDQNPPKTKQPPLTAGNKTCPKPCITIIRFLNNKNFEVTLNSFSLLLLP